MTRLFLIAGSVVAACVAMALVVNTDAAAEVDGGGAAPETIPVVPLWNSSARIAEYVKGKKTIVVKKLNTTIPLKPIVEGSKAFYYQGKAFAPEDAPEPVKQVIWAGNKIQNLPYLWGGGHGSWNSSGYDCSGSVSFALHGAKLINFPMASGGYYSWGKQGVGKWLTIYTNEGHMYMTVAGLRFDTSGANPSRWQSLRTSNVGYVTRHPVGL